jgi:nitroreductase
MDVKEVIKSRRSIRKYKDKPVPQDRLATLLEMARLVPSAGNRQPWEFIIVRDKNVIRRIAEVAGQVASSRNALLSLLGAEILRRDLSGLRWTRSYRWNISLSQL